LALPVYTAFLLQHQLFGPVTLASNACTLDLMVGDSGGLVAPLSLHSFLFITNSNDLEADNEILTTAVAEHKEWRKKGQVVKLHSLSVDLARSVQHEQKFNVPSHNRGLPQDNKSGIPGNV
jgi:hypothetical protein